MSRGRIFKAMRSMTFRCRHAEAVPDLVGRRRARRIGSAMSIASETVAMVLAVNWAPHAPAEGQATCSSSSGLLRRHLPDRVLADSLEQILHGDGTASERARQDRAAIDEDRGHVQAAHGHHHAGKRFVTSGEADEGIVAVAANGEFDAVGDDFARRQRGLHALMPHGEAVGDGDGAEFARRALGGGDALLHGLGLAHQRDVAGRGLVPAGRNADEGLVDLLTRQPHRVIVGAMRGALRPLGHMPARQAGFIERLGVHRQNPAGIGLSALRLSRSLPGPPSLPREMLFRPLLLNRLRFPKVLWRKRGTKASLCCKLATVGVIYN